jgi:trigger factor
MSRQAMAQELDHLKKRAEEQVRSSLILEKIADLEKIEVTKEERAKELEKVAAQYRIEPQKLEEYYAKNPDKEEDFMYRIRESKTLDFLISKAKIR